MLLIIFNIEYLQNIPWKVIYRDLSAVFKGLDEHIREESASSFLPDINELFINFHLVR